MLEGQMGFVNRVLEGRINAIGTDEKFKAKWIGTVEKFWESLLYVDDLWDIALGRQKQGRTLLHYIFIVFLQEHYLFSLSRFLVPLVLV